MATRLSPADEAPFNIQTRIWLMRSFSTSGKKPSRSRAPCVPNIANGGSCSGLRASYRAGAAVAFLPAPEVLRSLIIS